MFKPARLCHVRTLCVHAQPLTEGTVTFFAQVVTFKLFAHMWVIHRFMDMLHCILIIMQISSLWGILSLLTTVTSLCFLRLFIGQVF